MRKEVSAKLYTPQELKEYEKNVRLNYDLKPNIHADHSKAGELPDDNGDIPIVNEHHEHIDHMLEHSVIEKWICDAAATQLQGSSSSKQLAAGIGPSFADIAIKGYSYDYSFQDTYMGTANYNQDTTSKELEALWKDICLKQGGKSFTTGENNNVEDHHAPPPPPGGSFPAPPAAFAGVGVGSGYDSTSLPLVSSTLEDECPFITPHNLEHSITLSDKTGFKRNFHDLKKLPKDFVKKLVIGPEEYHGVNHPGTMAEKTDSASLEKELPNTEIAVDGDTGNIQTEHDGPGNDQYNNGLVNGNQIVTFSYDKERTDLGTLEKKETKAGEHQPCVSFTFGDFSRGGSEVIEKNLHYETALVSNFDEQKQKEVVVPEGGEEKKSAAQPEDTKQLSKVFDSCAVVGNSNNLENRNFGIEIDEHDIVIRFSCAPTKNFESDVGSKTSFRFVYPEAMGPFEELGDVCGGIIPKQELNRQIALVTLYKEPDINWWLKYSGFKNRDLLVPPNPCCYWRNVPHPKSFEKEKLISRVIPNSIAFDFSKTNSLEGVSKKKMDFPKGDFEKDDPNRPTLPPLYHYAKGLFQGVLFMSPKWIEKVSENFVVHAREIVESFFASSKVSEQEGLENRLKKNNGEENAGGRIPPPPKKDHHQQDDDPKEKILKSLETGLMPKQGTLGIAFALQYCKKVTVYGFGTKGEKGKKILHAHYYDTT